MSKMFSYCSLTSLDLSSFDTNNVLEIENMFFNCEKLEYLDISSFSLSKIYFSRFI